MRGMKDSEPYDWLYDFLLTPIAVLIIVHHYAVRLFRTARGR